MSERTNSDPYTDSGAHAAVQARTRMQKAALDASFADADQLERRGHSLIARSRRMTAVAGSVLGVIILISATLMFMCYHAYDGTHEGLLMGNWSMLGALLSLGAANFAWAWLAEQRRIGEVGRKLIMRADYQRRRAALVQGKADESE